MKKFITGLVLGLLLSLPIASFANSQALRLVVNGEDITAEAQPIIIDGRTLVPARALAEKLGASVEWDGASQTVTVKSENARTEPQAEKSTIVTQTDIYYSSDDIATGAPWYTKDGELVQVYVGGDKLTYENLTDQTKSKVVNIQSHYGPKDNLGRQKLYYLKSDVDRNGLPVHTRDSIEFSSEWIEYKDLSVAYNLSLIPIIEEIDGYDSIVAYDAVTKGAWTSTAIFRASAADGTLICNGGKTYLKKTYVEEQLKKAGLL